ncbi:hypothetical protein KAI65_00590 [Candidatus Parcubacteria bacterium]|nr:hypothetical protein [Candidatus Parcubacteria bacterium]
MKLLKLTTVGTGHCPVRRVKNEKIINIITKIIKPQIKIIWQKQGSAADRTGQCPVPTNNKSTVKIKTPTISTNPQSHIKNRANR